MRKCQRNKRKDKEAIERKRTQRYRKKMSARSTSRIILPKYFETLTDLGEIMCRNYYQIWVAEKRDDNIFVPEAFGSAIMFGYKQHLFLLTAEHVVSPANDSFPLDPEKTYVGAIGTNQITMTPEGQISAEVVCFNIYREDYTQFFRIDPVGNIVNRERVDFSFFRMDNNPQLKGKKFITQGWELQDGKVLYNKMPKLRVEEGNISEPNKNSTFAISGLVQNDIDKERIVGKHIIHPSMMFNREENGKYFFNISKYDEFLDGSLYWRGLSGAAIYNEQNGTIVGIATRYYPDTLELEAISMRQICIILDGYIKTNMVQETNG